jgi:hypothetical protein
MNAGAIDIAASLVGKSSRAAPLGEMAHCRTSPNRFEPVPSSIGGKAIVLTRLLTDGQTGRHHSVRICARRTSVQQGGETVRASYLTLSLIFWLRLLLLQWWLIRSDYIGARGYPAFIATRRATINNLAGKAHAASVLRSPCTLRADKRIV